MKFTWKWLNDHLETDKSLDEIAEILPMLGLEVDNIENKAERLKEFKIAKVIDSKPHPNADRLKVLTVDDASGEIHQVVCGAPNARKGLIGVFASPGMYIPGTGINLKVGEIRGEKSFGMMCSEKELEISDDHDGIIELDEKAVIGKEYVNWAGLDDPVISIGITPNRADCLGVRGVAQDLSAANMGKLKPLKFNQVKSDFESPKNFKISEDVLCKGLVPIIVGRYFRGLNNGQSPQWMRQRLKAIGQRPISALVDITNYIMVDICRPLHAYDGLKIIGNNLEIRFAKDNEKFNALNEKTYELSKSDLVISDDKGVDDLAGIMGGERTGVSKKTTEMFLETAIFDPNTVSRTGRRLNLNSDARHRFERGLDQNLPENIQDYIASFVLDICGGETSYIHSSGSGKIWERVINFDPEFVFNLSGVKISDETISSILINLGFKLNKKSNIWDVNPPSWRNDIDGAADLVEEVIRIYGYDNIPINSLENDQVIPNPAIEKYQKRNLTLKRLLAGRGMLEAITYSFISEKDAKLFNGGQSDLILINPISSDLNTMRPSLFPNLLTAVSQNFKRGETGISMYEIGPIFKGQNPEDQIDHISGIRAGFNSSREWTKTKRNFDWIDAKADLESVLKACGFNSSKILSKRETPNYYHPGRSAAFFLGKNIIAFFGELHPRITNFYNIKNTVVGFEVFPGNIPLPKKMGAQKKFLKLNPFQSVERDFSFIVDKKISAGEIIRSISSLDKKLIKDVRIFDLYEGEKVPENEKALGVTIIFQPDEMTFSDSELDEFSKKIIQNISSNFNGRLRD